MAEISSTVNPTGNHPETLPEQKPSNTGATREGYLDVQPDFKLFYAVYGPADARHKLLLVMGYATTHKSWEPTVDGFKNDSDYQLCIYDNRGVGFSTTPAGNYSTPQMADDAIFLADHLKWDKFHLVGVSMGGMISEHVAAKVPHRLISLTLICTRILGGWWNSTPPLWTVWAFLKVMVTRDPVAQVNATMDILFPQQYLAQKDKVTGKTHRERLFEILVNRKKSMPPQNLNGIRFQQAAVAGHGLTPHEISIINKATFPVLLLTGDNDVIIQHHHSETIKNLIPRAELVIYPGVGHAVIEQAKTEVNQKLRLHFEAAMGDQGN